MTVRATPDPREITANLRAPLVIHEGRGFQLLNTVEDAPLQAPLFELAPAPAAASGALGRRRLARPRSAWRRGSARRVLHNRRRMLILTRRPGERVVIGDNILVTVMGVSGHTVRLGIEAPKGVSIYREEIWLAVEEENRGRAPPPPRRTCRRGASAAARRGEQPEDGLRRTPERRRPPACIFDLEPEYTASRRRGDNSAPAAVRLAGEAEWALAWRMRLQRPGHLPDRLPWSIDGGGFEDAVERYC